VVVCAPAGAQKNWCLVGCADGNISIWDLDKDDAEPIHKKTHSGGAGAMAFAVTSLAFSPDGAYFASGGADGSICLWNTDEGTQRYAFVPKTGVGQKDIHEDPVTSLASTPQSRLISAGRDNSLRVWHLKDKGAHLDGKPVL